VAAIRTNKTATIKQCGNNIPVPYHNGDFLTKRIPHSGLEYFKAKENDKNTSCTVSETQYTVFQQNYDKTKIHNFAKTGSTFSKKQKQS